MDEKVYKDLIVNQLAGLKFSAERTLPADHPVNVALGNAITAIMTGDVAPVVAPVIPAPAAPVVNDDAEVDVDENARVIPVGFANEQAYDDFLAEQVDAVFTDVEDRDELVANITDVVGMVDDGTGNYVEVGDVVASGAAADELVAQFEEENDVTVEVENAIYITYSRLDQNELTEENVRTIINHPISASLKHLGQIQYMGVEDGDALNSKKAVFGILEKGAVSLQALAVGAAAYRGTHVIPGLGRVSAVGSVNFI